MCGSSLFCALAENFVQLLHKALTHHETPGQPNMTCPVREYVLAFPPAARRHGWSPLSDFGALAPHEPSFLRLRIRPLSSGRMPPDAASAYVGPVPAGAVRPDGTHPVRPIRGRPGHRTWRADGRRHRFGPLRRVGTPTDGDERREEPPLLLDARCSLVVNPPAGRPSRDRRGSAKSHRKFLLRLPRHARRQYAARSAPLAPRSRQTPRGRPLRASAVR